MGSTLQWATGSNRFSSKQSVGRRTAGCNISALLSRARRADGHPFATACPWAQSARLLLFFHWGSGLILGGAGASRLWR